MVIDRGGPLRYSWRTIDAHAKGGGSPSHSLAVRGPDTVSTAHGFQDSYHVYHHRRLMQWDKDFGATTVTSPGGLTAVVTAPGTLNYNDTANALFLRFDSNATLNEVQGINCPHFGRWDNDAAFSCKVRSGVATSVRYWVGMFDVNPALVAPPGGASLKGAAFCHDSTVYGTNWQAITMDGTSATVTDTGVAIANNTRYAFRIEHDGEAATEDVKFYESGVLVATHTANLPTNPTSQLWAALCTNLTAGSRQFRWSHTAVTRQG